MYHHHHHPQNHNNLLSSRTTFPPERPLFLQGGGILGESGLVLSTDAKPRLKWTAELHERFIEAVNQLGGADKATPKTVMRLMGIPGLTLYHLKSHLQKYRLSKNLQAQGNIASTKSAGGSTQPAELTNESNGPFTSNLNVVPPPNETMQISEALQMQIEVQRRLHDQLEVQRHLQLRIEAQGKYLQSVLEKAQETLGKQNLGSAGLEAAKVQLSELVSKVSDECFTNAFPGFEEINGVHTLQACPVQHADYSVDSCLTTSEGSQKDQDINNNTCVDFRTYHVNPHMSMQPVQDCTRLGHSEQTWYGNFLHEHKAFSSPILRGSERMSFSIEKDFAILPLGKSPAEGGAAVSDDPRKERDDQDMFLEDHSRKRSRMQQQEKGKQSSNYGMAFHATQLDLNTNGNNEDTSNCKRFDLNGFS